MHAEPRPNDILAYFLVGVTKEMRLKGFSELAATTRAACTMLSRQTSERPDADAPGRERGAAPG